MPEGGAFTEQRNSLNSFRKRVRWTNFRSLKRNTQISKIAIACDPFFVVMIGHQELRPPVTHQVLNACHEETTRNLKTFSCSLEADLLWYVY